jgi:hypothetical protein
MKTADRSFAAAWLEEWRAEPSNFGTASRRLRRLVETEPDEAWRCIRILVEAAATDEDLDCIGAGPLEDLLCAHGETIISQVESAAIADPKLTRCVYYVWGHGRIKPEIYERIRKIAPSSKFTEVGPEWKA